MKVEHANIAVETLTLQQWNEILGYQNIQYVKTVFKAYENTTYKNTKLIFLWSIRTYENNTENNLHRVI